MKRGATKEEIIRTTLDLITRNGLRAVRVDEIAQVLGISKRTLYEMFADKNDLISACLNDMARQQRQHIDADRKRRSGNALQKTLRLVNTYVDSLYKVDPSFLSDIRHKIVFAEYYDEHREFWFRELARDFDICRNEGLLLAEIDSRSLAEQLIGTLFELRLNNTSREEGYTNAAKLLEEAIAAFKANVVKPGIAHFGLGSKMNLGASSDVGAGGCLHRGDAGPLLGVCFGRPVHHRQRVRFRRLHGPQTTPTSCSSTSTMQMPTTGTEADAARSNSTRGTTLLRPIRRAARWSSTSTECRRVRSVAAR